MLRFVLQRIRCGSQTENFLFEKILKYRSAVWLLRGEYAYMRIPILVGTVMNKFECRHRLVLFVNGIRLAAVSVACVRVHVRILYKLHVHMCWRGWGKRGTSLLIGSK